MTIFSGLSPDEQRAVARMARPIRLVAGERLYGTGDDVSQLFAVQSGRVRVVRIGMPGYEQLIRLVGPGEVVGEYPFLTGRPPVAWVFAVEPTRLCVFDHRDLAPLIAEYPQIALKLLQSLAEQLGEMEGRLATLAAADVPTRLAGCLLSLPAGGDIQLPMSKRDLASYLGTTPESLSRALHRLEAERLIRVGEGGMLSVLDRGGLESLLR